MGKIVERGWERCVGMGKNEERCGEVSWMWRKVKEDGGVVFENVGRGLEVLGIKCVGVWGR